MAGVGVKDHLVFMNSRKLATETRNHPLELSAEPLFAKLKELTLFTSRTTSPEEWNNRKAGLGPASQGWRETFSLEVTASPQ